jgi:hypothetical protein
VCVCGGCPLPHRQFVVNQIGLDSIIVFMGGGGIGGGMVSQCHSATISQCHSATHIRTMQHYSAATS